MGIEELTSPRTISMCVASLVATLLATLVVGHNAAHVEVMLVKTGNGQVECDLAGDTKSFRQVGVSYSIDGQRLLAVEYSGNKVQCCHVDVLPPAPPTTTPAPEVIRWRSDYKCGQGNNDRYGNPAICNPNSSHHCCSPWGWCDNSWWHCKCNGCVDWTQKLGTTTTTPKPPTTTPKPLVLAELTKFTSNKHPCTGSSS